MIRRLRNAAFSTVFSFEFVYTLTLFCGIYKGDQRFAWLPIDLTIVLAVMSFFTGWVIIAKSGDHEGVAKPNYRILVAFALFVLLIATSYLWSASREYAAKKAITFCLLGFALTCGTVLIIAREKVRVRRFAGILLAFGIWIIVEALFFVKREGSQAVVTALGSDLTPGDYIGLAATVGICIAPLIALAITASSALIKVLSIASVFGTAWVMILIGARGPIIALLSAGCLCIAIYCTLNFRGGIKLLGILAALVGLSLFALLGVWNLSEQLRAGVAIERFFSIHDHGLASTGRPELYAMAWNMFMASPFIGGGVGSFTIQCFGVDFRAYPHNIVLEILAELGIAGFFAFLYVMFRGVSGIWAAHRRDAFTFYLVCYLCVFSLCAAMFSGDLSDNRVLFAFLGLGAAGQTIRRVRVFGRKGV